MFRNRGGQSPVRRLAALPPGTYVRMHLGGVYVKQVTRFLPAGIIGHPIGPKALLRLNGQRMPTVLVPVADSRYAEATW